MKNDRNRIEIIDGLRGFAILIVAWYHIWQQSWLWTEINFLGLRISLSFIHRVGFFGVEIFFLISGFCIFLPFAEGKYDSGSILEWGSFFKKRLIRIIPSYYLLLLIAVPLVPNFPENISKTWYLIRHLLLINSFFPDTYNSLYCGVLWSLSIEFQFYILFPLLCRLMKKNPIATFITTCSLANLYRIYVLVAYPERFYFLFNQLPGTIDLFVGGMLAAYIYVNLKKRFSEHKPDWLMPSATIMSVFAFLALMELFKSESVMIPFYMPPRALPIQVWQAYIRWILLVLVMMLVVGGCFSYRLWYKLFANRIIVFLSSISYNLYLWHAYIALALKYRIKIPPYQLQDGVLPNVAGNFNWQISYTLLSAALSIITAAFITFAFERPFPRIISKIKVRKH